MLEFVLLREKRIKCWPLWKATEDGSFCGRMGHDIWHGDLSCHMRRSAGKRPCAFKVSMEICKWYIQRRPQKGPYPVTYGGEEMSLQSVHDSDWVISTKAKQTRAGEESKDFSRWRVRTYGKKKMSKWASYFTSQKIREPQNSTLAFYYEPQEQCASGYFRFCRKKKIVSKQ